MVAELKQIKIEAQKQNALLQPNKAVKQTLIFEDSAPTPLEFDIQVPAPRQLIVNDSDRDLKTHSLASQPLLERETITPETVIFAAEMGGLLRSPIQRGQLSYGAQCHQSNFNGSTRPIWYSPKGSLWISSCRVPIRNVNRLFSK